jgi:hypothetical protein
MVAPRRTRAQSRGSCHVVALTLSPTPAFCVILSQRDGTHALTLAADAGCVDILAALLDAGASVNATRVIVAGSVLQTTGHSSLSRSSPAQPSPVNPPPPPLPLCSSWELAGDMSVSYWSLCRLMAPRLCTKLS